MSQIERQFVPGVSVRGEASSAQELLLALFGLFALDDPERLTIAMGAAIRAMMPLGISETATRMSLNRMTQRNLLARHRHGRAVSFALTEQGASMLRRGRERLFSPHPFGDGGAIWTFLALGRPRLRSGSVLQFETQLRLAGFATSSPGFWIAPGRVSVETLLTEAIHSDDLAAVCVWHGVPAAPTTLAGIIERTWNLAGIHAAHEVFFARWNLDAAEAGDPLSLLIGLVMDWTQLLQTDPGLPAQLLRHDWPAHRSAGRFTDVYDQLRTRAECQLDGLSLPA